MARQTRQFGRRMYNSRSWSPFFYDITTVNYVNMVELSTEYYSVGSPRNKWNDLLLQENPFVLYRSKVTRGYASCMFRNEDYRRYTTDYDFAPVSIPVPETSVHIRACLNDAWRALVSKVGELKSNLALMIAERQETVNLVAKGLKMIYQFSRAFRLRNWNEAFIAAGIRDPRGRSPDGKTGTKVVANAYLALNLGLLPIASDIYDMINKKLRPPSLRVVKHSNLVVDNVAEQTGAYVTFATQTSTTLRAVVTAKADIPNLAVFAANIAQQLGAANPAALAWEMMPYSFVVNWFVDIAGFLAQFSAFSGLDIIECSETVTQKTAIMGQTCHLRTTPGGFSLKGADAILVGRSKGSSVSKVRVLVPRPPWLPPVVPIPGLSVGKMVTLAALVAQYRLK